MRKAPTKSWVGDRTLRDYGASHFPEQYWWIAKKKGRPADTGSPSIVLNRLQSLWLSAFEEGRDQDGAHPTPEHPRRQTVALGVALEAIAIVSGVPILTPLFSSVAN